MNVWLLNEIQILFIAMSLTLVLLSRRNIDERRQRAAERLRRNEPPKAMDFFIGPYLGFWLLNKYGMTKYYFVSLGFALSIFFVSLWAIAWFFSFPIDTGIIEVGAIIFVILAVALLVGVYRFNNVFEDYTFAEPYEKSKIR